MHELLASLPRVPWTEARGLLLLDTCFLIDMLSRRKLHELLSAHLAVTSFNAEELERVARRLHDDVKEELRRFLKGHPSLVVVDVPVHPGDPDGERAFVEEVDDSLLRKVPDPSDAVLAAVAFATRSDVLTKDKHHLFTTALENYVHAAGIHVWKEWKDAA